MMALLLTAFVILNCSCILSINAQYFKKKKKYVTRIHIILDCFTRMHVIKDNSNIDDMDKLEPSYTSKIV